MNTLCRPLRLLEAFMLVLLLTGLIGCSEQAPPTTVNEAPLTAEDPALIAATDGAWQQGTHTLTATLSESKNLRDTIIALLADPSSELLDSTREQWHKTHNHYQQAAIYISLGHSNPGMFGALKGLDNNLDAWPIQPGYLDAFDVYSHSGIVNDIAVPISADAIRQQHGFSDDTDVSIGFHAMAYLLWGDDGKRPVGDLTATTASKKTAPSIQADPAQSNLSLRPIDLPNNRRRTLLKLLSELLIDDIKRLQQHWQFANGNLSKQYHALHSLSRLTLIQSAVTQLLVDDILATQLNLRPLAGSSTEASPASPPRDETLHNRFSGHTAQALAANLRGIEKLLLGKMPGAAEPLLTEKPATEEKLPDYEEPLANKKPLANKTPVATKSIISWTLNEPQQAQWQQHLQAAQQRLATLPSHLDNADAKELEALRVDIAALAVLLQPQSPTRASAESEPTDG